MELKDFYYSNTIASHARDYSIPDIKRNKTFFKGIEYTECVEHGSQPICNCDDAVLVGTGTYSDITIEKYC